MTILLSVTYSGTRLLHEVILKDHIDRRIHLRDADILNLNMNEYFIAPIRRPENNCQSFNVRGGTQYDFNQQWKNLSMYANHINFIHIDEPDIRDIELKRISEDLGIEINTNWPMHPDTSEEHKFDKNTSFCKVEQWQIDFYNATVEDARGN